MPKEKPLPSPSSNEVLSFSNIDQAIDSALLFCEHMELEHSHWMGVPPREDRREQARESVKLLRGFYSDINRLNTLNWEEFRAFMESDQHSERTSADVAQILELGDASRAIWISAAKVELPAFLKYLDSLKIGFNSWQELVNTNFNPHRISIIVSDFLSQHVGVGEQKIVRRYTRTGNIISSGFDGDEKSCPISIAPGRGIVFFSYMCAEYVLMNAIVEKFNSSQSSRNEKN